jgi:hypothetical protein
MEIAAAATWVFQAELAHTLQLLSPQQAGVFILFAQAPAAVTVAAHVVPALLVANKVM